jgi:hypothetical protein
MLHNPSGRRARTHRWTSVLLAAEQYAHFKTTPGTTRCVMHRLSASVAAMFSTIFNRKKAHPPDIAWCTNSTGPPKGKSIIPRRVRSTPSLIDHSCHLAITPCPRSTTRPHAPATCPNGLCSAPGLSEWPSPISGEMRLRIRCLSTLSSGNPPSVCTCQLVIPLLRSYDQTTIQAAREDVKSRAEDV